MHNLDSIPSYCRQQLKLRINLFRKSMVEKDIRYWCGTGHELLWFMQHHKIITTKQWLILMQCFLK